MYLYNQTIIEGWIWCVHGYNRVLLKDRRGMYTGLIGCIIGGQMWYVPV